MYSKSMLLTVLLCYFTTKLTQQSPLQQNYTVDILRLSKAAHIKAFLKESRSPCDNFYSFACGNWAKLYPAKENPPKTSYLQHLQELYVQKSGILLKEEQKTDNTADIMLKNFFKSCTGNKEEEANNIGIDVILDVINFRGGWPKIEQPSWYETDYDWLRVIAQLRQQLGVNVLVGLEITPSFEETDMYRIRVGAPALTLGTRDMYLNDKYESERKNFTQTVRNILQKYFKDMPDNWSEEIADQVIQIEQLLAEGLPINNKLSPEQQTRLRFAHELKSAYGNYVDLSRYLNLIFNQTILTQIYETPEDYMANLVEVIKKTPKLTIANYTVWRVLEHFERTDNIERPRSERACVQEILKYYPQHMESLFQRNSNSMQMVNELQSVWADIRRLFREDLQVSSILNWMTTETRNRAVQKLDLIDLDVEQHDDSQLQDQMFGLNLRADNYFQNLIKTIKWHEQRKLARLYDKPRSVAASLYSFVPKYDVTTNKIKIPIIFLQPRYFWDPKYPHALKYSTLGILLAQEMLHAFDNFGINYDKYGHRANWWDTVSTNGFNERTKCFEKQYEEFKREKVSAAKRLSTAIVDNGALRLAYRAYQKWFRNTVDRDFATSETLPQLNYTQNQLFFIGYGQLWCADYDEAKVEIPKFFSLFYNNELMDDVMEANVSLFDRVQDLVNGSNRNTDEDVNDYAELLERRRVLAALANFDDFAEEFECSSKNDGQANTCIIY